jgi:hypothetical protein
VSVEGLKRMVLKRYENPVIGLRKNERSSEEIEM